MLNTLYSKFDALSDQYGVTKVYANIFELPEVYISQ